MIDRFYARQMAFSGAKLRFERGSTDAISVAVVRTCGGRKCEMATLQVWKVVSGHERSRGS